jgi:hypothetical protein
MNTILSNLHSQYIVDEQGNKTSVIIPLQYFEELLEDLADLAALVERRNESTISHEDLILELKQDGLL